MLMVMMFLLVAVPNAPLFPTTVAHAWPTSGQTNGLKQRATSKTLITSHSTFPDETMVTTAPLEGTTYRGALTIPLESKSQYHQPTHETTTDWVSSSTNLVTRTTESSTRSTPYATIRDVPSATTRSTSYDTMRSIPYATSTNLPSATTKRSENTTDRKIAEDRSTTGSFVETSPETPRQSSHVTKAATTEDVSDVVESVSATTLPQKTTYRVPSNHVPSKSRRDDMAKRMTASMADDQTTTPKTEFLIENSLALKPVGFRSGVSTSTLGSEAVLSPGINRFQSSAGTSSTQNVSTISLKSNRIMKSNFTRTALPFPVPSVPIPSQVQENDDVPQNAVGPMYHLPWISPKTTSVPPESEFGNMFHPKLASILPRRTTKTPKGSSSRDPNKTTPGSVTSPPSLKPNAQLLNYFRYGTTVPSSPVFNLLGNQSQLRASSDPIALVDDQRIFHSMLSVPVKSSTRNQSELHRVFPSGSVSSGDSDLMYVVPVLPVQIRSGNESALHPEFPSKGSSTDNPNRASVVPVLPVQTTGGNESALHPNFPSKGASTDNPKRASVASVLPVQTRGGNASAFYPRFPSKGASPSKRKPPPVMPVLTVQTRDGNKTALPSEFPSTNTSSGNPKHSYAIQYLTVQSSDGNQSVLHPLLPSNPKLHHVVPSYSFTSTETLPPEILPVLATMDNGLVNVTENCTNDYCVSDEDYIDMMLEYMFPTHYEWVLIGMHFIVFIGGLVGNALVCLAVYRNHSMRTVTNYFIVNLAVADFLVILLCLPPTVLWDVTETWFMGTALCKIVLYFQTVSVAVSVLTLTFISIDRWYAVCCPLKFKSTTARAKTAIAVIWVLALASDIPELVVLQTKRKELNIDTMFFTQCEPSWSDKTDMAFHCLQTLLLYTIPLVFMSIAYFQIVKVLWSSDNIPGHKERLDSCDRNVLSISCRSDTIARKKTMKRCISSTVSTSGQLICRRKAAKMLVAVVIVFAVCYFPVHLLSILRYTYDIPQTDATTACAMVSHWLCYANSAVNPVIYNFMSGKFRKEFAHTFGCHGFSWRRRAIARKNRRRQTVSPSGGCGLQPTEMAPLSRNGVANVGVENQVDFNTI